MYGGVSYGNSEYGGQTMGILDRVIPTIKAVIVKNIYSLSNTIRNSFKPPLALRNSETKTNELQSTFKQPPAVKNSETKNNNLNLPS